MSESSSVPERYGITAEWLQTLREANGLKLKDMLQIRHNLIAVYIEEDGWDKNYKRSALHVAVNAGCCELVAFILDIFKDIFTESETDSELLSYGTEVSYVPPNPEREGGILTERTIAEARILLKDLLVAIDGYSQLNALAIAVVNKEPSVLNILLKAYARFGYPTFTYLLSEAPHTSSTEECDSVAPQSDDEHAGDKLCDVLQRVCFQLVPRLSERGHNLAMEAEQRPPDDDELLGDKLRNTIRDIIVEMGSLGEVLKENFKRDSKLNFLPWDQYMYHHVVGNGPIRYVGVTTRFTDLLKRKTSEDPGLARYLLKLRDGSGRTPISSAVPWHENDVFSMIPAGPDCEHCLNVTDFAGRTLLHRAAADGPESRFRLLVEDYRTNLNAVVSAPKTYTASKEANTDVDLYDIDIDALSGDHNFSMHMEDSEYRATPLYLAIIHWKEVHVKHLLSADAGYTRKPEYRLDLNVRCVCDVQYSEDFTSLGSININPRNSCSKRVWTPLQLAALMGQEQTLMLLANDDRAYDPGRLRNLSKRPGWRGYQAYAACQLAAASGSSVALRVLLDSKKFDPQFKDEEGNSALHFAVRGNCVTVKKHLMDVVSCQDHGENSGRSSAPEGGMVKGDTGADTNLQKHQKQQIQDTVRMLLRAGLDIWNFKENNNHQIADPGPAASSEMRSWWNNLLDKAILEVKYGMQTAANAVAVTAALVATASYVGPLQPPLGYSDSQNGHIHTDIVSVKIFVVCDTMAFYLAVAGIMFAMMPSLSLPQEPVMDELQRIKWTLTLSIVLLIISIVSVLGAFAAASIAVISNEGAWNQGGLTTSTAVIGILICLSAVAVWCFLMMRLLFYKNGYARRLYMRFSEFL